MVVSTPDKVRHKKDWTTQKKKLFLFSKVRKKTNNSGENVNKRLTLNQIGTIYLEERDTFPKSINQTNKISLKVYKTTIIAISQTLLIFDWKHIFWIFDSLFFEQENNFHHNVWTSTFSITFIMYIPSVCFGQTRLFHYWWGKSGMEWRSYSNKRTTLLSLTLICIALKKFQVGKC